MSLFSWSPFFNVFCFFFLFLSEAFIFFIYICLALSISLFSLSPPLYHLSFGLSSLPFPFFLFFCPLLSFLFNSATHLRYTKDRRRRKRSLILTLRRHGAEVTSRGGGHVMAGMTKGNFPSLVPSLPSPRRSNERCEIDTNYRVSNLGHST